MEAPAFTLDHPAGFRLSRGLTESDLLRNLPSASTKRDMKTGWVWYYLPPFKDGEREIGCSLGFNRGVLEMLDFGVIDARFETERVRAEATEQWLKSRGFGSGKYSWGAVETGCDPKTGDGYGVVRFAA